MRSTHATRGAALVGAAALLVAVPATASTQVPDPVQGSADVGKIATGSLGNLAGGGLASVGLPGLGSAAAGGKCVAIDPAFGSSATTVTLTMTSKEKAPGVAVVHIDNPSGGGSSNTSGVLHWKNETTGAHGDAPLSPFGGGDSPGVTFDLPTGAGHVSWSFDGTQNGYVLSLAIPLAVGSNGALPVDALPGSSAPYSACSGAADIR